MQNSVANQTVASLPTTLRLGTRTSQLALWQTNHVIAQLQSHWPHLQCELIHKVTQGDRRLDRPLPEIGGKGLFTAELEEALRHGEIDLAVHSLKDLPVEDPSDLMIGAILSREDTRDVLVAREGWTLATLPTGAVIGTSSLRRQAQLLAARPDLEVRSIRGNVETRLRKVMSGEYHAAVMAGAGLLRLGLTEQISEWLAPDLMLPAPGQGALAVQCRTDDPAIHTLLRAIHDPQAAATTKAERHLLWRLGGGCSAPIGAWAEVHGDQIELQARVASVDGRHVYNASGIGTDAQALAEQVADDLLAQGAQTALSRDARSPGRPLAGKRVVITRPRQTGHGAEGNLAAQLRAFGAQVIEAAAIQLVPSEDTSAVDRAIHHLGDYDWIIFTSANAVEIFLSHINKAAIQPDWQRCKIAAVGPRTQSALQSHGLPVHAMPEQYLGAEIAGTLGDIRHAHILLPRSAEGNPDLPARLHERGATVEEIALYAPVPAVIDEPVRATLAAGVDVVTFASGSAVRAFVNALRTDDRFSDFWQGVTVACIGPTTADAAQAEGLAVQVVATEHSVPGLVAALVAYYEQGA
ncbi:MAG: hydroxymethylbilane synthase [Caldilineaceae bacterium]|nr:hydroxymethylbilane synthase [Caldilineaceae bacterium]